MPNTLFTRGTLARLMLASGNCQENTLKASISVNSINSIGSGISMDRDGNTPWSGTGVFDDKLYLTSGQFTGTLKDSVNPSVPGSSRCAAGIDEDGNTPWCDPGASGNELFTQSGQIEATIKASYNIESNEANPLGFQPLQTDGVSLVNGSLNDKNKVFSGYLEATLKDSVDVSAVESQPFGIATDLAGDTLFIGPTGDKLWRYSGRVTGTAKSSVSVSAHVIPQGIASDDMPDILGSSASGGFAIQNGANV